ncbi:lanthionine synthetase LanC family protein [Psychroserpens sp.]|uniref:lanthionine synthetase LanC family protein n=1 Tax=Psychroserpens sp. TaxID=2020870 RepID=UPI00385CCB8B
MELKNKIIYLAFLLLVTCIVSNSCSDKTVKEVSSTDWVSLAMKTENYIQKAKYSSPYGTTWKVMPDSLESIGRLALYNGTPGVILFYLELYQATNNKEYLKEAESGADFLIDNIPYVKPGLYTGLSGIGFTLKELYKITNDSKYKNAVIKIVELLESSSESSPNGIHWGKVNDIISGSAGIGLFLYDISDEFNYKKADSLAILVAEGLIDNAVDTLGGFRWKISSSHSKYMDNFSHGTAGVSYFLSETYLRTKNKKFLNAALKAGNTLNELSNDKGYISHHIPGGEELYYLSWCHGPAGTSKLYYSLYKSTGNEKWLDKILLSANSLMQEEITTQQLPGFWNNVGKCCGSTGVAEHYLWLYNTFGNDEYLNFSNQMTTQIIANSSTENNQMKWVHAENRRDTTEIAAQTGLMQGSAGIGMWFLRFDAFKNNREYSVKLPDEPKTRMIE